MGSYLGQNFLKDIKYIDFAIQKMVSFGCSKIFEIGPGKGALTKKIVKHFDEIYLFEKDETFIQNLQNIIADKGKVFVGDFLEADLHAVYKSLNVDVKKTLRVGNLPYYITSPIFRKLFVDFDNIRYGIFLIQKEVGEKISTDTKDKSYLWRLLNYRYDVKYLKTVPAKAFNPPPRVQSCFVQFTLVSKKDVDFQKLLILLDNISQYKRKTLGKIWKINQKKNLDDVFFIDDISQAVAGKNNFLISKKLAAKRLQELTREDMKDIVL